MGCGGSTQARSPDRRFRDPTPNARAPQPMMGAYPNAPPAPQQYGGQPTFYQGQPGAQRPVDPAYPPPPQGYPPPPMYSAQPTAPAMFPQQQAYPVMPQAMPQAMPHHTQTTVVVRERRRSHGDGMAIVGGFAMGAMMGAALSGSFSSLSCGSGFSFD